MTIKTIIIFDLEATCWERETCTPAELLKQQNEMEVIEIGAVKVDAEYNILDQFQIFCKPKLNPILTDFCKTLTSIKQEDVDNAVSFEEAYKLFQKWSSGTSKYIAWGAYDNRQIEKQLIREGINLKPLKPYYNGKEIIREWLGYKGKGLGKELQRYNIPFEGERHRAINDAIMTSKLLQFAWKKTLSQ